MRELVVLMSIWLCGAAIGQVQAAPGDPATPAETPKSAVLPDVLHVTSAGDFRIDGVRFGLEHFAAGWGSNTLQDSTTVHAEAGYPKNGDEAFELLGTYRAGGGMFQIREMLRAVRENQFRCDISLKSDRAVNTERLAMVVWLDTDRYAGQSIVVDGSQISIPKEKGASSWITSKSAAQTILVATPEGMLRIEGPVDILLQDDRQWGLGFGLRLLFLPEKGEITDARLKFAVKYQPNP